MKKLLSLVLLSVVALTGCAGSASTDSVLTSINESGTLVIGNELAYSPYNWINAGAEIPQGYEDVCTVTSNNEVACGIDIAVGLVVADELGVELDVQAFGWDGLIPSLNKGDFDMIIAGMSATEERAQSVDFSTNYLVVQNGLLVQETSSITSIDDLSGAVVGVQLGTIQAELCKTALTDSECSEYQDYNTPVIDLVNGNVDAVIAENTLGYLQESANEGLTFIDDTFEGDDDGLAIAIKKGNEDLVAIVNEALSTITNMDEIVAKVGMLAESGQ